MLIANQGEEPQCTIPDLDLSPGLGFRSACQDFTLNVPGKEKVSQSS